MSFCRHEFPWLSCAIHLNYPSFPKGLLDYIWCPYRVVDKFLLVHQHLHVRVKGSIGECHLWVPLYFSSSVPNVLFVLVLEMGGTWPYRCCFVGCCFQDLFNIACSVLVQFPSSIFSICLVSVHVVHPYSSIYCTPAWKKLRFILTDKSHFHIIDKLSIAVHAFASHILMSFSVDEMLLLRYEDH